MSSEPGTSVSRRDAMKKGALIGGALVWSVPAIQAVGMGVANAQGSPVVPPPPPPPPTGKLPSHGFVLIFCKGKYYIIKIDEDGVDNGGQGQDVDYLKNVQGIDYTISSASRDLLAAFGASVGVDPESGLPAYILTVPTTICSIVQANDADMAFAYVFDGELQKTCGDGDKFTNALRVGNQIYFSMTCRDPETPNP